MKKIKNLMSKLFSDLPMSCFTGVALLFLLGAVAGSMAAASLESSDETLEQFLSGSLSLSKSDYYIGLRFWQAVVNAYKYQLAAFVLGLSILGIALVPLLSAARGFFLSLAVTAMVRTLGSRGVLLALGIWGVQSLLSLPIFLIFCSQAFISSLRLFHSARGNYHGKVFQPPYFFRTIVCSAVLLLCAVFETFVTPSLTSLISGYIW